MAQASNDALRLEAITITASPLEERELETTRPISVLRGEELREETGPSISETLSQGWA